jgi:hypothetical protein
MLEPLVFVYYLEFHQRVATLVSAPVRRDRVQWMGVRDQVPEYLPVQILLLPFELCFHLPSSAGIIVLKLVWTG